MAPANETTLISNVVKALGIIMNTGTAYDSDHPVFERTLEGRAGAFQDALKAIGSFQLVFQGGQISYKGTVLEPGSDMFERLSRRMASKGIQGLTFKPALTLPDIRKLADYIKQTKETKSVEEIRGVFARQKIKGLEVFAPKKGTGTGEGTKASDSALDRRMFELDVPDAQGDLALDDVFDVSEASPETTAARAAGALRGYVGNVLDSVVQEELTMEDAADTIAEEFESRLAAELQDYRAKTEARIQRLENIKDLVLDELESLELAAIVVDLHRNVVAMNHSGREILGRVSRIEDGHPLAQFLVSAREKQNLTIDGKQRTAHLVISESAQGSEGAMLICLE